MKTKHKKRVIFLSLLLWTHLSFSQTTSTETLSPSDSTTIDEVDSALNQSTPSTDAEQSNEIISQPTQTIDNQKLNVSDYSGIVSESSYSDFSIVQRNYMPKSSRLQVKVGLSLVTNDVFFTNMGFNLGATYHFNETWGLGFYGTFLNSSANSDAKNIKDVQRVDIENLVTLKNAYGANLYYTPIYGKWALLGKRVIPFEIYFSGGLGQISNQSQLKSTSFNIGAGQLISLNRSSALDINLNWLFYSTKNINNVDQSNNSLLVTVAYTLFWPEPTYR